MNQKKKNMQIHHPYEAPHATTDKNFLKMFNIKDSGFKAPNKKIWIQILNILLLQSLHSRDNDEMKT